MIRIWYIRYWFCILLNKRWSNVIHVCLHENITEVALAQPDGMDNEVYDNE